MAEAHKEKCQARMLEICEREFPEELKRLQTIPGIKERAGTSLIAEIGTDMNKFETANHLASWSGLKPRNDESNKKIKSRSITHGNVYLRKTIIVFGRKKPCPCACCTMSAYVPCCVYKHAALCENAFNTASQRLKSVNK